MTDNQKDQQKQEDEKLLIQGHEYDGIKELNHPLPRWWLYGFIGTIIFSIAYFAYYEWPFNSPNHDKQLEMAMAEFEKNKENLKNQSHANQNLAQSGDALKEKTYEELLKDKEALQKGKTAFIQFCAACHGQNGEGTIGPNLTDNYWIHSKDKGMPPWDSIVPKEDQKKVVAFILSLKGTNPPNAKGPEGNLVE